MKKRSIQLLIGLLLAIMVMLGLGLFLTGRLFEVELSPTSFRESNRRLNNSDRGFYTIRAFTIHKEPQIFEKKVWESGNDLGLQMVQINLRNFRSGEISEIGLQNVEKLFSSMRKQEKRSIIRFLYDWDGKASETEPEELEIVLAHMHQLSPILKEYDDCVFLYQGLFVGNWGEMNGTPFLNQEGLERLVNELLKDVGTEDFLSVRTPVQWRKATGGETVELTDPLVSRLGLYNDGILGNYGDCGTYVGSPESRENPYKSWSREDELSFQEELCKYVPNGGEVILENPLNDFDSAVDAFRTMHLTYLNWDYDRNVLEKWASSVVTEDGCFDGMDGLTYIERHLGYRYLLERGTAQYHFLNNELRLTAQVRNVGFAPVYSEKPMTITLRSGEELIRLEPEGDLRQLAGGNHPEQILDVTACIPASMLKQTSYQVYFEVWDPVMDAPLELANEQTSGEYGYYLGELSFERLPWYEALFGSAD